MAILRKYLALITIISALGLLLFPLPAAASTTINFNGLSGVWSSSADNTYAGFTWQGFNYDPGYGVGSTDEIILRNSVAPSNIIINTGYFNPVSIAAYTWTGVGHIITFRGYRDGTEVATADYTLPQAGTNPGTTYSFPGSFANINKLVIDPTTYGSTSAGFDNFVYSTGAPAPTLTTPAVSNLGANQATFSLRSNATGRGYFTVLTGSGTACGTGTQVQNGQDSAGGPAFRFGSLPLTANVAGAYTVRNLGGGAAYTLCFTADDGVTVQLAPATVNVTTTAASILASAWTTVGSAGFSADAPYTSLSFAPDGTPYVAYQDFDNSGKATVMKYSGGSWTIVGSAGFSAGAAYYTSLSFAPDGTPYVAYRDNYNSDKATVMKYSGGSWTTVGSVGFSAGVANDTSLSFAPDGTPYVAYRDFGNSGKATVMKYSGGSWTPVGSPGFSAGAAQYTSLSFAPDGTPYVAYQDNGNSDKATVMKYSSGSWTTVGSPGFSAGTASYTSLSFAPDGTPYVAYRDNGNSQKTTVMKYSGGSWTAVGSAGFSAGFASNTSLSFAPDGTPYVAYQDGGNSNKATVMKYSGGSWTTVGSVGFSAGVAYFTSLSFAPDGTPYVAYQDNGNSNKATVMRLPPATTPGAPTITGITPGSGQLSVAFTAGSNGGSTITNYKYSTDNGSTFTAVSPAQTTSPIVITGLTNGTTYQVQIKAVNAVGDGTATASSSGTPATTPTAPTITGITPGNGQLSVAFTAGATGGSAITNYKYSTNNGSTFTAVSPAQTTSPIVITGLTNGTTYQVQIKAVNAMGDGTATASSSGTPATTPSAPTITGITPGNGQLSVVFTAGATGGSAITNYKYSTDNGSTFTAVSPAATTSPIVITGLTNGTTYQVQIKAVNAMGDGSATASSSGVPVPPPTITGITPGSGPTAGGTSVTITGTNLTAATAVKFGATNATGYTVNSATQITATSPAGSAGTVDITVTTAGGTSATSASDQFTYVAPTLTTPAVNNLGANQATFSLQSDATGRGYFTVLTGSGTTCGTGTQVQNGQDSVGGPTFRFGSLPLTANVAGAYTVRNLGEGTNYTLCFTADDGVTMQPAPATVNFTTTAAPILASSWTTVGIAGFSAGSAPYTSLSFAPDGTPYVAYQDSGNSGKATVKKYDGSSWADVGSAGFSAGSATYTSLSFAPDGTPYVVFTDGGNSSKVTVKKYDGSSWADVGSAGFSAGAAPYTSLSFAPDGTPYVAYRDGGNSNKATVMKYSGGSWTTVGSVGFSANVANNISLSFAPDGTPYVAYRDFGNSSKATVMKYDGSSWADVGSAGFSAGSAPFTSLSFAPDGTPYVAYGDGSNSSKATVKKYDGSSWADVGSAGFSADATLYTSLSFAPDGAPYVAYRDGGNSNKATVMKYSGGSWTTVGSAGFSAGQADYTSPSFAPNGTPYVAYQDFGNSGKATVMRLPPATTPGAPTIIGITPGNGQLSVAFTAGATGGSAITNYKYSTDNGSTFTAVSPAQTTSPIVITGLTNGTTYQVQIKAVNAVGDGIATASSSGAPVPPPTITGITPGNGPTTGGTSVIITGTNLSAATAVKFGATNATGYTVNSATQITATSPAGSDGTVDITVTTAGGTSTTGASDQFTYVAAPTITKAFGAASIPLNGSTSLSFTVTNPAANSFSLTGVAFTDSLPAGLVVATPNGLSGTCGGGTITATAGASSVSLSGATLAQNSSCTFSVNIKGTTAGVKNNSVQIAATESGTGNTSNASITVVAPPVIIKAFGAASIPLNGSTSLTFTIQNNNATTTLNGVGFSDTLPAGLVISTPNGLTGSCGGGTITATQGINVISLSGATIAQSSSCSFSVNVAGTAAGTKNSTTGNVTSTEGGTGNTASANLAVVAPPTIAQAFGAANIALNGSTTLTFTITNPAANTVTETGVAFSDTLPTGLVVATPNGLFNTCGGTPTAVAGSGSISLTNGTVATNSSCTVTVNVTGTTTGTKNNTSGVVSSTNGGTGNTASASLSVGTGPAITSTSTRTFTVNAADSFQVTTTGIPLPALSMSGTLPSGVTFSDNGDGSATISGTAALGTVGDYPITITASNGIGGNASQNFTLTIAKTSQTVTLPAFSAKTYGNADFGPGASASTGLAITYASDTPSVATITAGGLIHIVAQGTAVITATQVGDGNYNAASIQRTLIVDKAVITVTADNKSRAYNAADPAFTASHSGFVNGEDSSVITGAPTFSTTAILTSPEGSYTITPDVSGLSAANYTFTGANGTLAVGLASQTITFNPLANKTYGDATFDLSATGGASNNTITYTSSDTTVATVSGATVTIKGAGTTTITASQAGIAGQYASATAQQNLTVNKAVISVTAENKTRAYNTADPAFTVIYSGFVNGDDASVITGSPTFTTTATIASSTGSYPITPVATGLSASNYTFNPVNGTLGINVASQSVSFDPLSAKTYGDVTFDLSATGGASGNPVTFSSSNPAVATINGTTVTIKGAGNTTITASQTGSTNYASASAQQTLTVNKATLTVKAADTTRSYNSAEPAFSVSYSGFVYGENQSVVLGAPALSTAATLASPVGSYPIIPAAGNLAAGNYDFTYINGTLTITPATPVMTWSAPSAIGYGTLLSATQLNAFANVPGTITYTPASGTLLGIGAGQTLTATFIPSDTTNYVGVTRSVAIDVGLGMQSITFAALASQSLGTADFEPGATASSGLPVSYISTNTAVATIVNGKVHVVGIGTTTITASQGGNSSYSPATSIGRTLTVTANPDPPTLYLSTLSDQAVTTLPVLNVSGIATDINGLRSITINGANALFGPNGSFSYALNLARGANVVTVVATNNAGNSATAGRTITFDPTAPVITVVSPADNASSYQAALTISGTVSDSQAQLSYSLNGAAAQHASMTGTTFSADVTLAVGLNTIELIATDLAGKSSRVKRSITYNPSFALDVTEPSRDTKTGQTDYLLKGSIHGNTTAVTVSVEVDGQTYTATMSNGSFEQLLSLPDEKVYAVMVSASDQNGATVTAQRNIMRVFFGDATSSSGGNGAVGIGDALVALKAAVGLHQATPTELLRIDVAPLDADGRPQGNGIVDIADVVMMLRQSIGLSNWQRVNQ